MLLFGQAPQRFLISSEIKCAHFHGTEGAKPIPSYQVYKGTVFALVDQAVDFVMSKIALSVGTRAESVQVPVKYEIPKEVVTEAIVNAVAHRDYTDSSSVQVMLFADRLEVMNSGRLPPALTVEKLRVPHPSLPGNPLLAESMYLLQYIERMGTGTVDMIRRCAEAGLPEPEFDVGAGFLIRIWRAGVTRKPPEGKGSSQNLTNKILTFLREHPSASRRDIAGALEGATEWSVRYQMGKLKKAGRLRRIGPDRGGRWLVVDGPDADPREEPDDAAGDHRDAREIQPVVSQKTARKHQKTARSERQSPEPQSLSDRLLALLRQNPSAGRREIAATLGTTRSIARYRLDKLRAVGKIERVGPDKGGYWRVVGESAGDPDAVPERDSRSSR